MNHYKVLHVNIILQLQKW